MEIIKKHIDEIIPYEKNPRFNDNAVDAVAKSIQEFGWKVPIVIDKNNVIVTGHTRYKAALKLGINIIPCIVADDLTDTQIKAYRIADNKVADYSIWDNKKLLEELDTLNEFDVFTGFELGDLFDETLDEFDNTAVDENEKGVVYEIVFKSENKDLIDKITKVWEKMSHEK